MSFRIKVKLKWKARWRIIALFILHHQLKQDTAKACTIINLGFSRKFEIFDYFSNEVQKNLHSAKLSIAIRARACLKLLKLQQYRVQAKNTNGHIHYETAQFSPDMQKSSNVTYEMILGNCWTRVHHFNNQKIQNFK